MTEDDIKAAEARGYSKGYSAGRKRLKEDVRRDRDRAASEAFRRRAFLAVLPSVILMDGWTTGDGKPITTRDARVKFAWDVADHAMQRY